MANKEIMTAFQYLKELEFLPISRERGRVGRPSNSELRRWLQNRAVIINGDRPLPDDEIILPIYELVFFPSGQTCTMVGT